MFELAFKKKPNGVTPTTGDWSWGQYKGKPFNECGSLTYIGNILNKLYYYSLRKSNMFIYDTETDQFSESVNTPDMYNIGSAAVVDSVIYVTAKHKFYVYDPVIDQFSTLADTTILDGPVYIDTLENYSRGNPNVLYSSDSLVPANLDNDYTGQYIDISYEQRKATRYTPLLKYGVDNPYTIGMDYNGDNFAIINNKLVHNLQYHKLADNVYAEALSGRISDAINKPVTMEFKDSIIYKSGGYLYLFGGLAGKPMGIQEVIEYPVYNIHTVGLSSPSEYITAVEEYVNDIKSENYNKLNSLARSCYVEQQLYPLSTNSRYGKPSPVNANYIENVSVIRYDIANDVWSDITPNRYKTVDGKRVLNATDKPLTNSWYSDPAKLWPLITQLDGIADVEGKLHITREILSYVLLTVGDGYIADYRANKYLSLANSSVVYTGSGVGVAYNPISPNELFEYNSSGIVSRYTVKDITDKPELVDHIHYTHSSPTSYGRYTLYLSGWWSDTDSSSSTDEYLSIRQYDTSGSAVITRTSSASPLAWNEQIEGDWSDIIPNNSRRTSVVLNGIVYYPVFSITWTEDIFYISMLKFNLGN